MKKPSSNTAILVFTRSLESEIEHKKLCDTHNEKVIHQLINQSQDVVKKTCLPYFISSDKFQIGESFGERLYNEISRVLSKGYEKIIVIGNDSPELTPEILINASKRMDKNNILLGPSVDGGVYLIGVHKQNLKKELFINIPWLSQRVFSGFKSYAKKLSIAIEKLELLRDIDSEKDLRLFIEKNPIHKWTLFIISLLGSNAYHNNQHKISANSFDIIGLKQLRAPPQWAN